MYKRYRSVVALLLLGSLSGIVSAQNTNTATPDAKLSMGNMSPTIMGNLYTPNLYNGTMNINIPIYSFSPDNTQFGISLGYNTMGVRVDEYSSEISTHWNLQAEPSVTRIVRDLPDECFLVTDSVIRDEDPVIINRERYIKGKLLTYTETAQEQAMPNVYRDGECDEFIFTGGGQSVSFYIGNDFKVFTHPHRNIHVEVVKDTLAFMFGFPVINLIITDEQGIRYEFVPGDLVYLPLNGFSDWQWAGFDYQYIYAPNRWVPRKVTLADGREILYTHTDKFSGPSGSQFIQARGYMAREIWASTPVSKQFIGVSNPTYGYYTQLSGIVYPNGVNVSFITDPDDESENGADMVNEIKVSSDVNCTRYKLYRDSVNHRWFLDKIALLSCDGSIEEPFYSFTYDTTQLPDRLNSAQDLFGYYNGDPIGTALGSSGDSITIPSHGTGYGNDRASNPALAKAGLLTGISNAYGGKLALYYGMNVVSGQLSGLPSDNNFLGGAMTTGVRVDSIMETDRYYPNDKRTTTYTYSGGQLFLTGGYFHFPEYIDSLTGNWDKVVFQDKFLTAHQLVNGANHGYSNVSVKSYINGALESRRDYTFTNMKDATSNNQPRYYKVPGSKDFYQYPYTDKQYLKDWEIGLPLTVAEYDRNNRILGKTINKYQFSPVDLSAASYVENAKIAKVNSGTEQESYSSSWVQVYCPYQKVFTDTYYPFTGTALLDTSIILKYVSDSRYVADTVVYLYDSHNKLKSTITQTSEGGKTETTLVYNYDVDGPDMPSGYTEHPGTTLYKMTADGLEKVVSTERWKLGAGGERSALLDAYVTLFNYNNDRVWAKGALNTLSGTPIDYTQYALIPIGGPGNPYGKILDAYNTSADIDNYIRTTEVKLYDVKGNPQETRMLGENQYKIMIWDTATGQKLAEAANCRYTDIAYTSFESSLYGSNLGITQANYTGNGISGVRALRLWTNAVPGVAISVNGTQNLAAGKEYTLSFWVNGINPNVFIGATAVSYPATPAYTSGNWKNYILKFTPSASGKIKITGTGSNCYIDELRLYPSGTKMQSSTYTPLFGVSSQTDASGRITYYEYDKLGRQYLVRDQEGNILSRTDYHIAQ